MMANRVEDRMNKRALAATIKKIEAQKARIAKERDKLRDLIGEVENICEDCDEAVASMDDAADALSRML